MTRYIICTDGDPTYYVIKSTRSVTGFAWRKGEPGRRMVHHFDTPHEARWRIKHGFAGAGGQDAVLREIEV